VPLDPIVSLSVALAEAPGTCAFLLGSGVSRDAGVPTGFEVMREGLRRLHQIETTSTEPLNDEALDRWLAETDRTNMTYSELLALIAPDAAVRREYLAGFFEAIEPGPTHEALADMAADGLARVFVTTNFDRLLEHALQARGIEPVVIASDADLAAAMPREHAQCVVLKPHGDYLRETIRNTPEELAELEPGITAQLGEVFSRYGVVVLGYSGADQAIARALRARTSRFGMWWVARGELGEAAADLVDAVGGRVVLRDSAADFLADLRQRLAVFTEHPSGVTPAVAHDGTLALVRAGDVVGLAEELRRERQLYEREIERITTHMRETHGMTTEPAFTELWEQLRPVLERRLGSLLPLAMYDDEAFAGEVAHLARGLEQRSLAGGLVAWTQIAEFAATWLGYVIGALLIKLDKIESLGPLVNQNRSEHGGYTAPLVFLPGELSHKLGQVLVEGPGGGSAWLAPGWEFLTSSLTTMDWLRERYPELFAEQEPRRSMGQFDLLLVLGYGVREHRAAGFFALASDAAPELASRMHHHEPLRRRVATMLGLTLEDFDARAPQFIRDAEPFRGGFTIYPETVAKALESGERW
jgi:hypothetical protein